MRRHEYWHNSLSNYLERVSYEPFKWGKHDCALFIAGAVEAMTGEDVAASSRGTYSTAREAVLALRQHGEGKLIPTVTKAFGDPKHVAYARRGDVVSFRGSLGVCAGRYSLFLTTADDTGNTDDTAGLLNQQIEEGDLPDDEAEPPVPRGMGRTLLPVPTHLCVAAWSVPF